MVEPITRREWAPQPMERTSGPRFALRFDDGRGVLALAHPLRFAFGVVEALELRLGPLRFPLDLSAGPARFRTRRTRVQAARLRVDLMALVAGRIEEPYRLAPLAPRNGGLSWALTDPFGTVAFDARVHAEGPDLELAIEAARSAGDGPAPPLVRVFAGARALGLELDEVRGALRLERVLSSALMEALVPCGWRVPDDGAVRLHVSVLDRRHVTLRTLEEGEADAPFDPAPWERARRLAPIAVALARGQRDEARRAHEALRERIGSLADPLTAELLSEADALAGLPREDDAPLTPDLRSTPLASTVALRAAIREGRAETAAAHARVLADVEPCDAVAVEALCAAAELALPSDPGAAAALLELAGARCPRDPRLALRLIEALARTSSADALRDAIEVALAGREPGLERGELAREAALICELAQRTEDADRLFAIAAASLPNDGRVLEGLASAEARAGNDEDALRLWDRAAHVFAAEGLDDEAGRALVRAGHSAERLGRMAVAEERLTEAAERAPLDAAVWAELARIRRAIDAAGPASRAEDRLLESVEGLATGAACSAVVDALGRAARVALEGGELARARSFVSALGRVHGDDAQLRAELAAHEEAHAAVPSEVVPSEVVPSEVVPSEVVPSEVVPSEAVTPLARARSAALARDTAGLRAALNAAEREGDLEAARRIVELAIEVVGEGPARRALDAARRRLQ